MYQITLVLLTLLLLAINLRCDYPPTTIIQTTNGPIEGTLKTSILGQNYYAFEGVPYAAPPITGIDPYTGQYVDRRFKATEPFTFQFTEPFKANDSATVCQPSDAIPAGYSTLKFTENCLVLSIYVPADGADSKAIIMFLHGSGTAGGTTLNKSFESDFLLYLDNIVVFVEFRVQAYGWLNLNLDDYSGNMGLKDQQEALRWTHRNIRNFSGNRNEMLLFGESWGAAQTHAHMLNKESVKYFTRAYCASGSILNPAFDPWLKRPDQLQQMKDCFKINDTDTLINYLKTANSSSFNSCRKPVWIPVKEIQTAYKPFFTDVPRNILETIGAYVMDVLFSFTSTEGAAPLPSLTQSTVPMIKENWNDSTYLPPWVDFNKTAYPNEYQQVMEILKVYFTPNSTDNTTTINRNLAIYGNTYLNNPLIEALNYQTIANHNKTQNLSKKKDRKKTYLLRFDVSTDLNAYRTVYHLNYPGATHGEDLFYEYVFTALLPFNIYQKHLQAKDIVYYYIMRSAQYITNLARTGDPTIDSNTKFIPCKPRKIYCTNISNDTVSPITVNMPDQLYHTAYLNISSIYRSTQ